MYRLTKSCRQILSLLVAFWGTAAGAAWAQSPGDSAPPMFVPPASYSYPPPRTVTPVSYTEAPPAPIASGESNPTYDPQREIQALQQRLTALEAQLQAPANQPIDLSSARITGPTGGLQAQPTGMANEPPAAPVANADGTVPILTTPTLHIGAKAILDNVQFSQSPASRKAVGGEEDFVGFRFLRVSFYGDLYENIDYRLEIDLAQAASSSNPSLLAAFQDVWVNFRELPVLGHVKVGYFKEPLGMEQQTREESLLFMERFLGNALVPARRMGVMAYNDVNDDKTLSWFCGSFREGSGDRSFLEYSDEGDYGVTGRVVWLPYYQDSGRYMIHVGGAFEYTGANTNNADTKTFIVTPEVNAQTAVTSATIACEHFELYGLEAALIDGPLTVQSEYVGAFLPPLKGPDVNIGSAYFETLYLLTGENHEYNMPGKFITGVTPYEPFFLVRDSEGKVCRGWGAWEIGGRISYIDLDEAGGARVVDYTAGLNWYLTSNCSTMFNYIHSEVTKGGATTAMDIFGERLEWHF